MEHTQYAIQCLGLTKQFPHTRTYQELIFHPFRRPTKLALRDVNLEISRGQLVTILGPNGAGKTTLLKLLSTLILPTAGTAFINGYDLSRDPEKVKSQMGFVFGEERSFYWRLTGRENLEFFANMYDLFGTCMRKRVEEVLEIVSLKEVADTMFLKYSTGMKQRLSIARALLSDPPVLLMDEPTKSVDPLMASEIRTFIREELVKRQGKTVLLATHQLEEAEELSDRIVVLSGGRIRACGAVEEIRGAVQMEARYTIVADHLSQAGLDRISKLGRVNVVGSCRVSGLNGRIEIEFIPPAGRANLNEVVTAIAATDGELVAIYPQQTSLADALIRLTQSTDYHAAAVPR